ncbi:hypothetical protein DS98204_25 [Lactococcus phage 98204]|nr:hypothetical protein DS98204_25 [Lactococcus phage 98204]
MAWRTRKMTKFEEEVNKYNIFERTVYLEGGPKKILIDHFKNWHSDEEFQAEKDARKKEYEIHQDIYSKTSKKLNEAELEIANLKSQLQQQALPVVPECVADYISELKEKGHGIQFGLMCSTYDAAGEGNEKAIHWKDDNAEDFARAWLDGYTVEKPQLFYLKNKLTGLWLMRYEIVDKVYPYDHTSDIRNRDTFTQQEIDSMQTGSYEQIEVAE